MKQTKALNDKIVKQLKIKHHAWLGTDGQNSRDGFKSGIMWAIETIETLTENAEFEEVARQMMKHLGNGLKYHPHHTAIVTSTNAELVEGKLSSYQVTDYISDRLYYISD